VGELIQGLDATSAIVHLKGIESGVAVHRLTPLR
jgi:hypothetical protein